MNNSIKLMVALCVASCPAAYAMDPANSHDELIVRRSTMILTGLQSTKDPLVEYVVASKETQLRKALQNGANAKGNGTDFAPLDYARLLPNPEAEAILREFGADGDTNS